MKLIKYTLFGMLVFLSTTVIAQDNHRFPKIEELHAQKWQIIIEQAQLTPKEIEVVQPVFMEHEQALWKLHQENREFFKSAMKNAKTVKPNFAVLNDRYVENQVKEVKLFKEYHLKLRKLLQPETLFKYYNADRQFKRKLLKDFQDHKPYDKR
jgi:cytochrome c-type biogenesis protein CcmH/NrfG